VGEQRDALVIGAGPAGLAAAAMLRKEGVDTLVLERAPQVGHSWRNHYDRLHLHTVRWLSNLPGYRFSRRHGRWVSRQGVVNYLEGYANHHGLEVQPGAEVQGLTRTPEGWLVSTSAGDFSARSVVIATGYNHTPFIADWPGKEGYEGELLHASRYRNAEPYRGRDVLVVGSGNTGAEIAVDLVEGGAGRVRLAVRTPPNIVLRAPNGVPSQVTAVLMRRLPPKLVDRLSRVVQRLTVPDMTEFGLPRAERGLYTRIIEDDVIPIIDVGLIDAVRQRKVEVVRGLAGFDGSQVLLEGGERIEPDAVIVATGYRRGLEPLVGPLGLLGERGKPLVHGAETHPNAPGLHFIGFSNPISGNFREIAIDSKRIAHAVARELAGAPRRAGVPGVDHLDPLEDRGVVAG
jgi:putative flavoprotein involved in K+ transport